MFLWISISHQQDLCQSKTGKEYMNLQWNPNFRFPHLTVFCWPILFLWDGTTNGTKSSHSDRSTDAMRIALPSSRSLLLSAVWTHTHTPFLRSAGTWQAALLSRYIRWGSLHINPSHHWTVLLQNGMQSLLSANKFQRLVPICECQKQSKRGYINQTQYSTRKAFHLWPCIIEHSPVFKMSF